MRFLSGRYGLVFVSVAALNGAVDLGDCTFGTELESGPAAPAEPDGADSLEAVLVLQGFDEGFDLGVAKLFGVAGDPFVDVYFAHVFGGNDLASEATTFEVGA